MWIYKQWKIFQIQKRLQAQGIVGGQQEGVGVGGVSKAV